MSKENRPTDDVGRDGAADDAHESLVRSLPGGAIPYPLEDHEPPGDGDPADAE